MKKRKLIIYGIGRFAEYAAYVFEKDSPYEVNGFCMEQAYLDKKLISDKTENFIPFEKLQEKFKPEDHDLFIAVGNNIVRERIFNSAQQKGYKLATYISSKSSTWDNLKIGENCFVGEGSVLQPFTEIGNNSILFAVNTGHHSRIGDHTLLSACTTGGNVEIGNFSFLGLNSTVKENTKIGNCNIIGMDTAINSDTNANEIYSAPTAIKRKITFQEFNREYIK